MAVGIIVAMARCGHPTPNGPCRRRTARAGGCGVDHAGWSALEASANGAAAAAAGGDPFAAPAAGGDLYDTAGLSAREVARRAEAAVEMERGGRRLPVEWRQGALALEDSRCPARVLRAAYRTGDSQLVGAVLRNPRCPGSVLVRYWLAAGTQKTHAGHPRTPRLVLRWWAREAVAFGGRRSARGVVEGLAENPRTPPRWLARLAAEGSVAIQERVAANPSCPPGTLRSLAEGGVGAVRAAALSNPRQDPEVLARAANDGEHLIALVAVVAANPATPPAVLGRLAGHRHPDVRAAVAVNPSTPPPGRAHAGLLAD